MKAYLGFTRFTVRSKKKVNRQMGIALMALNMWKMSTSSSKISPNNKNKKKTIRIFQNFQKIRMVFFKDRDLCHSLLNYFLPICCPFENQASLLLNCSNLQKRSFI
uniref:hypothetical protein n=1 Tax=Ligilactobacillus murinus TaxID=1622 RepID=UPI003857B322